MVNQTSPLTPLLEERGITNGIPSPLGEGKGEVVKSTCPYCGVGCGVIIENNTIIGDPNHPANFGKLCGKGLALLETIGLEDRLLTAKVDGIEVANETATNIIATKFLDTIAKYGRDSVAFYVSGQLLTEDYYVANKLMKGYIGTSNIDSNSRLCMASSVVGHKRAFGTDLVPVNYSDCEEADLVVLVGSNLAWCHPVLFQRIKKSKAKLVVIDPQKTMTAREADLHLQIKSDTDVALFLGLLSALKPNQDYIDAYTQGLNVALDEALTPEEAARICDISLEKLGEFYALFAKTQKVVTLWSQGINQSQQGSDGVNAIINCHLYTGRLGKKGMGAFSITGQPNAMGGREVGALATMLASHIEFNEAQIVQEFWQSPTIATSAGLKAVDLFQAVKTGKIKAIWIMATNPAASMPELSDIHAALALCSFVVVSEIMENTDSTKFAHVILPALGWGEKQGTVTNSERRISKQDAFLPAPTRALQDWQWVCAVAQKMGFNGFDFNSEKEIFVEFQALSGYKNNGARDFDISGVTDFPHQWQPRPFEDNRFYTPSQKANFVVTSLKNTPHSLVLNTGRNRDQWHTMSRTGKSARLSAHLAEPYVSLSPTLALKHALKEGDIVAVKGKVFARAKIEDTMRDDEVFMPLHWTKQNTNLAVNEVVHALNDPFSGQPALKSTPTSFKKAKMLQFGYFVTIEKIDFKADYVAHSKIVNGYRCEWASLENVALPHFIGTMTEYKDADNKVSHRLYFEGNKLIAASYSARKPIKLARTFIEENLGGVTSDIQSLLAGFPMNSEDKGAIICACFQIGKNEIIAKTEKSKLAGTNCGSCLGEVKSIAF
jgi:assimilatory nitrate reductase catalytic subunit